MMHCLFNAFKQLYLIFKIDLQGNTVARGINCLTNNDEGVYCNIFRARIYFFYQDEHSQTLGLSSLVNQYLFPPT